MSEFLWDDAAESSQAASTQAVGRVYNMMEPTAESAQRVQELHVQHDLRVHDLLLEAQQSRERIRAENAMIHHAAESDDEGEKQLCKFCNWRYLEYVTLWLDGYSLRQLWGFPFLFRLWFCRPGRYIQQ